MRADEVGRNDADLIGDLDAAWVNERKPWQLDTRPRDAMVRGDLETTRAALITGAEDILKFFLVSFFKVVNTTMCC